MQQALLVRLRPSGPWRYGPSDGALDRVDTLYRSDRLYSAVSLAMRQLGQLDAWLDATARSEKPAVAFTSLFPFQGDTLYVTPPANLWPPPSSMVNSPSPVFLTKVRWRAAHFVPLSLVDALLNGQSVLADQWIPDPESGCLLRRDRPSSSPFRTVSRGVSPVDRVNLTSADASTSACVEFESGAGLWSVARFADAAAFETWNELLRAAFRLLADTGFGGGRSKGWGQVQAPEFESGNWPGLILPKVGRAAKNDSHAPDTSRTYWLMSLYSPSAADSVNWSSGQYELIVRNGRVDGSTGALKKSVRMVTEGCVLEAATEPVGAAVDVAPVGFAHPVYRSGIALALLIPPPKPVSEDRKPVEAIVPPELEATPFPFPVTPEEPVAPEAPALLSSPIIEPGTIEPITEPETMPEPLTEPERPEPIVEPDPLPEPVTEPAHPVPVTDPEPNPTPEIEPERHEPVVEPEPLPEPVIEPELDPEPKVDPIHPVPVTEPEHPAPATEPERHEPVIEPVREPISEPIMEVVPEDSPKAVAEAEDVKPKLSEDGYEI